MTGSVPALGERAGGGDGVQWRVDLPSEKAHTRSRCRVLGCPRASCSLGISTGSAPAPARFHQDLEERTLAGKGVGAHFLPSLDPVYVGCHGIVLDPRFYMGFSWLLTRASCAPRAQLHLSSQDLSPRFAFLLFLSAS